MSDMPTARGPVKSFSHQSKLFPSRGDKDTLQITNDDHLRYSSSTNSGSDSSSNRSSIPTLTTPTTTPASTPSIVCSNLPSVAEFDAQPVAISCPESKPTLIPPTIAISNISESEPRSLENGPFIIEAIPPPSLSVRDHIMSIVESSECRRVLKLKTSQQTQGTTTRRGPFTARGHYIPACLTARKRIKALYCIYVWVTMEDGSFQPYKVGIDLGSPYNWLYMERWKDAEKEVHRILHKDMFEVKVAEVNDKLLQFRLQSASTTPAADRRAGLIPQYVDMHVEIAESGTQDHKVFSKHGAELPHGLFGYAPANTAQFPYPVGKKQTILKRMYNGNFGGMRGKTDASHKFGFITLHLRKTGGFVKYGEPDGELPWFTTKPVSDWAMSSWSLLANIAVTSERNPGQMRYRSEVPLIVDSGQSITAGPGMFVKEIYELLGMRCKTVTRRISRQPGDAYGSDTWWTGYYILPPDATREATITLQDPNSHQEVALNLPSRFWNAGEELVMDGQSWRFGPLQIDETGFILGLNALELMDVHLKSNFEDDEHQISIAQNIADGALDA